MSSDLKTAINTALATFIEPYLETDLISAKAVTHLDTQGSHVDLKITLGYPAKGYESQLKESITHTLKPLIGLAALNITIDYDIASHAVQKALKLQPNIKNIIAVASGKGGVGKSTTSTNLALALSAEGANVGILDADIYGPSIPTMLGLSGRPSSSDGKTMEPKIAFGIQTNSIGYLIDQDQPMIWRGPMVTNALQQLLNDTNWDNLDYLLIDLPPGTGDIQLTLAQQIPVTAAIIVTTPQDIALLDAQRGLGMFNKVNIPVLGIVENMSVHICSECGHEEAIFGTGGGSSMAEKNAIPLLGALPLDITIRQLADNGTPIVAHDPDGQAAAMYREIARKMTAKLSLHRKNHSAKFGNIMIQ
ncbi:MAG: iron-sulfur cluster carrier protein ApbC [Methylococcales bacterium]